MQVTVVVVGASSEGTAQVSFSACWLLHTYMMLSYALERTLNRSEAEGGEATRSGALDQSFRLHVAVLLIHERTLLPNDA